MPLQMFLDKARHGWNSAEVRYIHPSLYLVISDQQFASLDDEERFLLFYTRAEIDEEEAANLYAANNVIVVLVTPDQLSTELGFLTDSPTAHHWIEFLANGSTHGGTASKPHPKVIHFYGYKGGQGRSTVLTMFAKLLADDGYRVLTIDADIEAPSLPAQFGARVDTLESTLLGCVQGRLTPSPQQVYVATSSGHVDMLACKPSGPTYNLDLAVFALNTALNPSVLEEGFGRVLNTAGEYDVVLVDHRSGIASSAISLVAAFPGPAVICVRLDEQSDEADAYLSVLFSRNPESPGLFVSFSLDPEDTSERLRDRSGSRIENLLDLLGRCISAQAERDGNDEFEVRAEALRAYWISWFHDRSFLSKPAPSVQEISSANRQSLMQMRELTDLGSSRRDKRPSSFGEARVLTNSGNTDEGVLIQTDALRKLRAGSSGLRYVFGRKGTGKTRLVRALIEEGYGQPLLTAEDVRSEGSINSSDLVFVDLCELLFRQSAADKLWWVLLDSVCNTALPAVEALKEWFAAIQRDGSSVIVTSVIADRVRQLNDHRVLLIDGVETAFSSLQMPSFVQGLFRFLAIIQANSQLREQGDCALVPEN